MTNANYDGRVAVLQIKVVSRTEREVNNAVRDITDIKKNLERVTEGLDNDWGVNLALSPEYLRLMRNFELYIRDVQRVGNLGVKAV